MVNIYMYIYIPSIIHHFQWFLYLQVLQAYVLFCLTADNTMQRDDFATKICKNCDQIFVSCRKIATGFFINFKPCQSYAKITIEKSIFILINHCNQ